MVKRSDQTSGLTVLPILERTIGWLAAEDFAKDWENPNRKALARATRLNPPHAQKSLRSRLKAPDRLLFQTRTSFDIKSYSTA